VGLAGGAKRAEACGVALSLRLASTGDGPAKLPLGR